MHRRKRAAALFFYRQIPAKLKRQAAWRANGGLAERRYRHVRVRDGRAFSRAVRSCFAQRGEREEEEEFAGKASGRRACEAAAVKDDVSKVDVQPGMETDAPMARRIIQCAAWCCSLSRCFMPTSL
jgi:hypothetical protein